MYVVSHIICKATAADSFRTGKAESITLSSPSQKKKKNKTKPKNNWKDCFAEQRMRTEEPVYYLSSREAAHFKAQSL